MSYSVPSSYNPRLDENHPMYCPLTDLIQSVCDREADGLYSPTWVISHRRKWGCDLAGRPRILEWIHVPGHRCATLVYAEDHREDRQVLAVVSWAYINRPGLPYDYQQNLTDALWYYRYAPAPEGLDECASLQILVRPPAVGSIQPPLYTRRGEEQRG